MNAGMRSSGLICILTNTFSYVDNLFTKCLRFTPQSPVMEDLEEQALSTFHNPPSI